MATEGIRIIIKDALGNSYYPLVTPECLTELLSIAKGGTGASTVEEARTNLSVYSKSEIDELIANVEAGETKDLTELTGRVDTLESTVSEIPTIYATISYVDEEIAKAHQEDVLVFKGVKETLTELYEVSDPAVGDAWLVHETEALYVWDGDAWHSAGETFTVDLSDYVTKEDFETLTGRVSTVESSVSELAGKVEAVESDLAEKADASAVTTLEGRVDTVETSLANKADASTVTSLSSEVEELSDSVSSLSTSVDEVKGTVTTLSEEVTEVKETVSTLSSQVLYFEVVDD